MSGRAYLSIGDVLTLLRQEFPDVTISKIRFLESQGLVNPERTPSGYRKFYEPDVERLRWVLRQQREHFLPLKVIKGRLEQGYEPDEGFPGDLADDDFGDDFDDEGMAVVEPALVGDANGGRPATRRASAGAGQPLPGFETRLETHAEPASGGSVPSPSPAPSPALTSVPPAAPAPQPSTPAAAAPGAPASMTQGGRAAARTSAAAGSRAAKTPTPVEEPPAPALGEDDRTAEELAAAAGCTPEAVADLQGYGLLTGRLVGGITYYGPEAMAVASLAARFAEFGVEARHLRLHKHAAEREAGFIEQVVLPLLKQRNPESRQRAHDTVDELSKLGQELRSVLLRKALRDQLGG